jgi:hypothetical protein
MTIPKNVASDVDLGDGRRFVGLTDGIPADPSLKASYNADGSARIEGPNDACLFYGMFAFLGGSREYGIYIPFRFRVPEEV